MFVSPAKMAEPIEMPFGMLIRVSPRNYVLDGGPDPHEGAFLRGVNPIGKHCNSELCSNGL